VYVVKVSAPRTASSPQEETPPPLLICVRGYIDPRTMCRKDSVSGKFPMTQSGIEPITFQLVALCLNRLRHRVNLWFVLSEIWGTLLVAQLVEALRYKSEGLGFDSRWCHWIFFHRHNPSCRTMALGLTQPLTEMSTRIISRG